MINISIHGINIEIEQGEFVVIYGNATAGKTSILRELNRKYPETCFIIRWDIPNPRKSIDVLRALTEPHDVYLLDEPTDQELDREDRMEILSLSKKLNDQGKTIIMATHDRAAIELGTRIFEIMEDKTFIDHGPGLHHTL